MPSPVVVNSGGGTSAASVTSSSSPDPTFKTRGTSGTTVTAASTTAGRSSFGSAASGMMNPPFHHQNNYYSFAEDRSHDGTSTDSNHISFEREVYETPNNRSRTRAKTPATNSSNLLSLDVSMEDQYTDRVLQNSDVLALKLFDSRMNPTDPHFRLSAHAEKDEDAASRSIDGSSADEDHDFGDNTTLSHSEMIKEDRSFFFFSTSGSTSDQRDFDAATLASSDGAYNSVVGDDTVDAVRGINKRRDEDYEEEYLEGLPPRRSRTSDKLRTRAALVTARQLERARMSPSLSPSTNNYFHYYHDEQRQQLLHPHQRQKGVAIKVYESAKGFWFWGKSRAQNHSRSLSLSPTNLLFYSPLGFVMGVSEEVCTTVAKMVGVDDLEKDVVQPKLTLVDDKVLNPVTNILSNTLSSWISPFWFTPGFGLIDAAAAASDENEKAESGEETPKIYQITLPESFVQKEAETNPVFDIHHVYDQYQERVRVLSEDLEEVDDDEAVGGEDISPDLEDNDFEERRLSVVSSGDMSYGNGEEAPDDHDDHESDHHLYSHATEEEEQETISVHVVEQDEDDDDERQDGRTMEEEGEETDESEEKHIFVHRGVVYESANDDFDEEHEGAWIPLDPPSSSCISS